MFLYDAHSKVDLYFNKTSCKQHIKATFKKAQLHWYFWKSNSLNIKLLILLLLLLIIITLLSLLYNTTTIIIFNV